MAGKIRRLQAAGRLALLLALAIMLLASPVMVLGITVPVNSSELAVIDFADIPEQVLADAERVACEIFSEDSGPCFEMTEQLVASYAESQGLDLLLIYNSGGWGWNTLVSSPNWNSIADGIRQQMENSGYKMTVVEYRRSVNTMGSYVDEFMSSLGIYPNKARELAARVDFITEHHPGLIVILAGESNGTVICDNVMKLTKDNPQVYSIQTGTPFWHRPCQMERTLVINDNGRNPDSFSNGDFFKIIASNLENLLGFSEYDEESGNFLTYLEAPGHSYSWQDTLVRERINEFLNKNFNAKSVGSWPNVEVQ